MPQSSLPNESAPSTSSLLTRRDLLGTIGRLMATSPFVLWCERSRALAPFAFWKKRASAASVGVYPTDTGDDPYWDYVVLCMNMDTPTPSNTAFNSVFADESNVGKTPTITGSPYIDTGAGSSPYSGRTGSARFNGSSDFLSFADSPDFEVNGDFTIETWVKFPSTPSGQQMIVGKDYYPGTSWGSYYLMNSSAGWELRVSSSNNGADFQTNSGSAVGSTWYHVAAVRASGSWSVYVNGTRIIGPTAAPNPYNGSGVLQIGKGIGGLDSSYLNGWLADLRIYNGVAKYTANFTPHTTPLGLGTANDKYWGYCVLACPFENSLKDMSGKRAAASGNTQLTTSVKKFGTASVSFAADGTLSLPASGHFNFDSGDFTVETFFNLSAHGTDQYRMIWYCIYGLETYVHTNGRLYFSIGNGGSWQNPDVDTGTSISVGTWYHLAIRRIQSSIAVFLNGQIVYQMHTTNPIGSSSAPLYLGGAVGGSTHPFLGYIDSLRITKGYARYTSNFTPQTTSFPVGKDETVDPFWSYTVLAMHMDDFTDTTGRHTFTNNSASINTSTYRFGIGSMHFNGSAWISRTYHSDFDFQGTDFTISAWVLGNCKITLRQSSGSYCPYIIHFNGNSVGGLFSNNGSSWQIAGSWSGGGSSTNWTHHAVSYYKGTLYFFLNGILVHSSVIGSLMAGSQPLWIGRDIDQGYATGYIDDLRITKGVARYVNNFTPPTRAFANSSTASTSLLSPHSASGVLAKANFTSAIGTELVNNLAFTIGTGSFVDTTYNSASVKGFYSPPSTLPDRLYSNHSNFNISSSKDYTIEWWGRISGTAYLSSYGARQHYLLALNGNVYTDDCWSIYYAPSSNHLSLYATTDGTYSTAWGLSGASQLSISDTTTLRHIALVLRGKLVELYENGSRIASGNRNTIFSSSTAPLRIGGWYHSNNFPGYSYIGNSTTLAWKISDYAKWSGSFTVPDLPPTTAETVSSGLVTSGLVALLDAGDAASYDGSSQTWKNICSSPADSAVQTAYDFNRGSSSISDSADPTFIGVAGGCTANDYFSFDGGDYFTLSGSNTSFLNSLHKGTQAFTIIIVGSFAASGSSFLFSTGAVSGLNPGFSLWHHSNNSFIIDVNNDAGASVLSTGTSSTYPRGLTRYLAISIAPGGSSFFYVDGSYAKVGGNNTFTATYSSPSTSAANHAAFIGAGTTTPSYTLPDGSRLYSVFLYNRALSKTELDQNFNAIRSRFGS